MGSADRFDSSGTLGIEEEYFVVDEDARPTSGTDELVHESDPPAVLAGRLDHELFKFVIEAQTRTLSGIEQAPDALSEMRGALVEHAVDHGYRIAASGLHPTARWRELERAEKPRYREQLDRIQYPQHRNTTAGLHVHVGVDDPDAAVWIADELRWFLPVVLALSANSPYWCGFDTGLSSARAKIFENLPTTGIPTAFCSYEAFDAVERRLIETDSITDRGEIWWDVRPHSGLGTVEVRVPDAQVASDRVLALVEYVHALVTDRRVAYDALDDPWRAYRSTAAGGASAAGHGADSGIDSAEPTGTERAHPALCGEGGEPIDPSAGAGVGRVGDCRHELLVENKWRALRYGHDAAFLAPAGGTISLDDVVQREADRLGVTGIRELASAESGASAQRRRRERDGVDALCESLVLSP